MCWGGSEKKVSKNNVGGNPDMELSLRPRARPRTVTYPEIENPGAEYADAGEYTDYQLKRAGFDEGGDKGVVDRYGNAVLDGNGNPVLGRKYSDTIAQAGYDHDNSTRYNSAYDKAQAEYNARQVGRETLDQDFVKAGLGLGGYLQEGFTPTNAVPMIGPANPAQNAEVAESLAGFMRNNYAGSGIYNFPGSTFNDPLGSALGSTLRETFEGSKYNEKAQRRNFDQLSKYYNQPFKKNLEADASGKIGESSFGQRFGDGFANIAESMILGTVLGPVGTALATGTDYNTMNAYGAQVPGYDRIASTSSFDYGNALGGILGDAAAGYAAPKVGQAIYDGTGSEGQAMMGAMATGIASSEGVGNIVGNLMSGIPSGVMSSGISSPWESKTNKDMEGGGFGSSLSGISDSGSDGNSSPAPDAPSTLPQSISTLNNAGLADVSADLGAESSDFNWEAWLEANKNRANPNTQQVTSISGGETLSSGTNPLFNARPDNNGVRYVTQGGTNRVYGNGTVSAVSNIDRRNASRRRDLNDKRVGVVIG